MLCSNSQRMKEPDVMAMPNIDLHIVTHQLEISWGKHSMSVSL